MNLDAELMSFFKSYGEAFSDGVKLSKFYGDCAMASTPTFVGCLKGDAEVRAALSNVAQQQLKTGMQSVTPNNIEVTIIDSIHILAKVYWRAKFKKTGNHLIDFEISYVIRRNIDRLTILLYIAHQDEQKMRQDLGLTSPSID